jgi:hypothetical protein
MYHSRILGKSRIDAFVVNPSEKEYPGEDSPISCGIGVNFSSWRNPNEKAYPGEDSNLLPTD